MSYHFNKTTGKYSKCNAIKKDCPLGENTPHFENESDAKEYEEKQAFINNSQKSFTPMLSNQKFKKLQEKLEFSRGNTSLSEMKALSLYHDALNTMKNNGLSNENIEDVKRAMNLAWNLHRGQTRKGQKNAYIEHPLSNMNKIMEYGVTDKNILIAAALHDTLEDTVEKYNEYSGLNGSRKDLRDYLEKSFNSEVVNIVEAVSNEENKTPNMTTDEKNLAYLQHVEKQIKRNQGAMLVKFSDYLDNAGTLKDAEFSDPHRKMKLAHKYAPLAGVFHEALTQHKNSPSYKLSVEGEKKFMNSLKKINEDLDYIINDSNQDK